MGKQNEDIALMDDCLDTGRSMLKLLKEQTLSALYSKYGVSEKQIDLICQMEDSIIENLSYQNMEEYLQLLELDTAMVQKNRNRAFRGEVSLLKYTQEMLRDIRSEMTTVLTNKANLEDVTESINEVKQNYIDFVHSDKFADIQKQRIEKLKESVDLTIDEKERKELKEKLEYIENLQYHKFLLQRLEELGEKEVIRLKDHFFSNGLGDFTLKKFTAACKRFKLASNIHMHFINLEEQFLPEEYHPFNNMFLFVLMNYVSYADDRNPKDCAYVDKIFNSLILLIQHKFYGNEEEQRFIDLIKTVDSYFLEYTEVYKEKNITWANHPVRVRHGERVERRKRDEILKRLKLKGIEADPSLDSVTLQNMLDAENAKMMQKMLKIKETEKASEEEGEAEVTEGCDIVEPEETERPVEIGRGDTVPIIYEDIPIEELGLEIDPTSIITVGTPKETPILMNPELPE